VLQEVVTAVCRHPVDVVGASRTDAGVHARGQVAAFDSQQNVPPDKWALAINARLPGDVCVLGATVTDDRFDPISWCTSKCYRYQMAHSARMANVPLLFERRTVWRTWHRLDVARMQQAAAHVVGTHDFASFAQVNHGRQTTVRTVHGCTVWQPEPGRITVEVAGSGFLYNMVRIIAGTLVDVGRGHLEPDSVATALRTNDRTLVGPTLPPHGLRLEWVAYDRHPDANGIDAVPQQQDEYGVE
jgi:tRNA pseudouridine38-40 synthase